MRCNRKQLADLIGRDVKTIDKMVEQGMPYVSRPQEGAGRVWVFETQAVIKWACGDVEDDTLKNAKLRLLQAKAELEWMKLGEELGYVLRIDDLSEEIMVDIAIVKSRILAMPGRLAHLLTEASSQEEAARIVRAEIDDILLPLIEKWEQGGWMKAHLKAHGITL